jgi:peptide/nickel transport system permease protein
VKAMKLYLYLRRRAMFFIPQLIGILLITFLVVRAIPGDPARFRAGPFMPAEGLELIREQMHLDKPIYLQFVLYVRDVFRGDLGDSWYTGNPVMTDIMSRLPGTLGLIVLAFLLIFLIILPIAIRSVSVGKGIVVNVTRKVFFAYGMAAGAIPDFWFSLLLIYIFYAVLKWAAPPIGQLNLAISPPTQITGNYIFDSLVTGNWSCLKSSLSHALLPAITLAFIHGGGISKVAIVAANSIEKTGFIDFAKMCGLPAKKVQQYINRWIYLPVSTMTAITFGFLVGGIVLVEKVFSWGGFGQYAVEAVLYNDYSAIQGVVVVSALLNLFVYIIIDLIYFWVDPRIKNIG